MILEIQQLHAGYRRLEILHDLSLHLDKGEIVSLIGATGPMPRDGFAGYTPSDALDRALYRTSGVNQPYDRLLADRDR